MERIIYRIEWLSCFASAPSRLIDQISCTVVIMGVATQRIYGLERNPKTSKMPSEKTEEIIPAETPMVHERDRIV